MSDFLGRLIQRSLPSVDRAASSGVLSPRVPGLFEPIHNEVNAPAMEEFSQQISDSDGHENSQNSEGPHPSVIPPARASNDLNFEAQPHEIASRNSLLVNDQMNKPAISTSLIDPTAVQPQVRRHEAEAISTKNQRQMIPLLPARSMPLINTTPPMSRHMENANPMIENPSQTTVRINIGRIEVRAIQPPQSVSPTRKTLPQAKMTIEEYAKQRSEGKS